MRAAVAAVRIGVAAAVLAAVTATCVTARQPVNWFNLFGFFTIQSNVIAGVVELGAAVLLLRGRPGRGLARAAATTYIVLTGVVYNTLLAGLAGGVALPWANLVLHTVVPAVVALDWVLVADRPALRWSRLWVVVPYPLVWLVVVLVRGATDGWVPYPFLNPSIGYPAVTGWCVVITIAVLAIAAAVWAASRVRLLRSGPAWSRSPRRRRG